MPHACCSHQPLKQWDSPATQLSGCKQSREQRSMMKSWTSNTNLPPSEADSVAFHSSIYNSRDMERHAAALMRLNDRRNIAGTMILSLLRGCTLLLVTWIIKATLQENHFHLLTSTLPRQQEEDSVQKCKSNSLELSFVPASVKPMYNVQWNNVQ